MTKVSASRLLLATSALALPLVPAIAHTVSKPARLALLPSAPKPASSVDVSPTLPRYLSLEQVKRVRSRQLKASGEPLPAIQPLWEGHALKVPMKNLITGAVPDFGAVVKTKTGFQKISPRLFAQGFPRPVAPASPAALRAASRNATPKWVRYPLEFQLAGIALGTRAVDKDRFNRIDRYGLFALHGNPTAVVRAVSQSSAATGGAAGGAPGGAAAGGAASGATDALGSGAAAGGLSNLTLQQQPPEVTSLFPGSQFGGLPDWALAVTVQLDNNHVEWLYKRDTYAMGFVVDRLGFCDAIIVSGLNSPISRTQLEDPVHTVKLGDDLRKVLFRYGYPDDIVPLAADPAATANATTGAPGGAGGAGGGAAAGGAAPGGVAGGAPGGAAGTAVAAAVDNGAYRTYDLRYEQSYNVVFTIRNNRVVRIYIFGDPDFFNAERRNLLRTKY